MGSSCPGSSRPPGSFVFVKSDVFDWRCEPSPLVSCRERLARAWLKFIAVPRALFLSLLSSSVSLSCLKTELCLSSRSFYCALTSLPMTRFLERSRFRVSFLSRSSRFQNSGSFGSPCHSSASWATSL